ncbi:transcriptional regulator [Variovorax paradoxus]|jgi:TetR/AcrR family tetracycline transcriptional repressor|uniref:tetracycline resistance transcriptional repressor TetR n=1 Tax=Variovorax TaxID=34072 RepID=UPI0006E717E8|nr:tetracycline resistance transcriptional repressor TetR [Variovorax sp. CY25R-8]KPU91106.1 transcriptional regulator [Variovorax paradoxus]KPU97026.1 transcriptional regulator [Variovorax paradoxus]KPV01199.1 transcriptional regulator [Variovorax paradoxus]KPV15554.1 transcriptional regulator [Variovorax paradoxus]KPV18603.1 transcriptional regulator [Variovorax paradoxus]
MKLDREAILEAALSLLDEVGMDKLSTRLLAERLGVQQPALYWHFKNKRALLDAMNGEILRRSHHRKLPLPDETWEGFLRENARSFRRALLARRDGARLHAGSEPDPGDLDMVEAQLAAVVRLGVPPAQAMTLLIALGRYTVGCVLEQQATPADAAMQQQTLDAAAASRPLLAEAFSTYRAAGPDALFEIGVDLMLEGAKVRLAAQAPQARRRAAAEGAPPRRGPAPRR